MCRAAFYSTQRLFATLFGLRSLDFARVATDSPVTLELSKNSLRPAEVVCTYITSRLVSLLHTFISTPPRPQKDDDWLSLNYSDLSLVHSRRQVTTCRSAPGDSDRGRWKTPLWPLTGQNAKEMLHYFGQLRERGGNSKLSRNSTNAIVVVPSAVHVGKLT